MDEDQEREAERERERKKTNSAKKTKDGFDLDIPDRGLQPERIFFATQARGSSTYDDQRAQQICKQPDRTYAHKQTRSPCDGRTWTIINFADAIAAASSATAAAAFGGA